MKNFVAVTLLTFIVIFSCKKKEEPATPPTTTVVGTTGTTGAITGTSIATFSALCSNQKSYGINGGFTYSLSTAQNFAVFTNTVFNNFNLPGGPYLNADTIRLNGKIFKNLSGYYSDTTNTVMVNPFTWNCKGAIVGAFSFTNTNPFATYADYVNWPDTIKKTESFTIALTSLQQANEVQLLISTNGNPSPVTYTALTSAGSINITTLSLVPLQTNTTAVIQCNFFKNNIQNIGGSLVNFRNMTTFVKTVEVKN